MRNLIQTIAAANFVADAKQVEALAHEHYTANAGMRSADGTYLKVVIVACQRDLGVRPKGRARVDSKAQLSVLENVHAPFYEAVLRGVTTSDIAADTGLDKDESARRAVERNRRSTFARSSKSTLVSYINAGGDLRTIDAVTTSKVQLRNFIDQGRSAADIVERTLLRSQRAILRIVSREAEEAPDAARTRLEGIIEMLQTALDELPTADTHGTTTIVASRGVPRSAVHQAPAQHMRSA